MKKAVAICLVLLYSFATIGATIHTHYCMGKLVGTTYWGGSKAVCSTCGMAKGKWNGCCREECTQVKLQTDQQLANPACVIVGFSAIAALQPVVYNTNIQYTSRANINNPSHPPPETLPQKLFVKNCTWRI